MRHGDCVKSFLSALCTVLVVIAARPAQAADIQIVNLYDANGFLPGFLIPFQIQGSVIAQGSVLNYSVTTDNSADCRVMPDPFLKATYLLKCSSTSNATLHFTVSSSGEFFPVNYGPVAVQNPGNLSSVGGGGSGGGSAAAIAAGLQIWNTNSCSTCHGSSAPMPTKPPASAISNAFVTVPQMVPFGFSSSLSTADVNNLAAYLDSLN